MKADNEKKDRLYSLEEVMADLAVANADTPIEKFELRLRQLEKLEKEGWPFPQSMEAVIKLYELYEEEGMKRGFYYPVFCEEFKKELQYSRFLFLLETGTLVKDDDTDRVKKILTIAENRKVTSKIAYRWHNEELHYHVETYLEDYDPDMDFELFMRLRFLHDLEIVMFREIFESI